MSEHGDAKSIIGAQLSELSDLADAAYLLGNDRLGRRLSAIAATIEKGVKQMDKAHGDLIVKRFEESQETSGALLKAALAGCIIGQTSSEAGV